MPKPPCMDLLITMSSEPQRNVNGTAIQTLRAKWSEKDLCGVPCWCQSSQSLAKNCLFIRHECTECQACEGSLAWMLYWNNAYLYTVHADLFNHKGSAQSTVLQVALLAKQESSRTFFVAQIGEQLAWRKWGLCQFSLPRLHLFQVQQGLLPPGGRHQGVPGDDAPWNRAVTFSLVKAVNVYILYNRYFPIFLCFMIYMCFLYFPILYQYVLCYK